MGKILATLFFVVASFIVASAQSEQSRPQAKQIDAFGQIQVSDMLARLDYFATELQNNPQSTGLIVIYPQTNKFPGWYLRRGFWAKGYLVKARGLDASRINVVNGGFHNEVGYELWTVPPGANSPLSPFDWAVQLSREKTPYLFDRFVLESAAPVAEYGDYEAYLDNKEIYESFVAALKSDPAARGYIIAYARRGNRVGTDRKIAAREKLSILKLHPIGADRIVAVGGGQRPNRMVEVWIVPPGAALPKPTPTVQPKRRKR